MDEPGSFSLTDDGLSVHVWRAGLDPEADELARMELTLDAAELARARRFHFAKDRRRFTAARAILRTLLGRYLRAEPEGIQFECNARGKPFVVSPETEVKFNVSHSGGQALFAFAPGREVGVDLEAGERLKDDWIGLTKRVFSAREREALMALPEAWRRTAFLNGWTRKEAFLKAMGLGISDGLQQIEVTLDPEQPPRLLSAGEGAATQWTLFDLRAVAGMAAALAVGGTGGVRVEAFVYSSCPALE